ncbi:MAG: DUF4166 domain-containing protein [Parvularculaceae bacterium]
MAITTSQIEAISFEPRRKTAAYHAPVANGDTRFRDLLSVDDWTALPCQVRSRFSTPVLAGQSVVFTGHIVRTKMSFLGKALAQLLKFIGAPLPLDHNSDGSAAVVTVTNCPATGGQFWTRQYNRPRGFPQIVRSIKSFTGPTGLEEVVGHFGMGLKLAVENQTLLFISQTYFLKSFGKRLPVPRFLSPGKMIIGHEDQGAGRFHFTLKLTHPLFGTLIDQCVAFQDCTR